MTKKKREQKANEYQSGKYLRCQWEVNIAGRDIDIRNTTTGLSAAEIKQLFDQVYSAIDARTKTFPAEKN